MPDRLIDCDRFPRGGIRHFSFLLQGQAVNGGEVKLVDVKRCTNMSL